MAKGLAQGHTTSQLNSGLSAAETQTLNRHMIGRRASPHSPARRAWDQWLHPPQGHGSGAGTQGGLENWHQGVGLFWTKPPSGPSPTADSVCVLNHRVPFAINKDGEMIPGNQNWQNTRALGRTL